MTYDGRIEAKFTVPASTTISVTNSGGGPTTVTLSAGSYYISTFLTQLVADLTAQRAPSSGAWTATLSTGASGTGKVTLNCTGTWSITWTSTNARDLLGFTANIVSVSSAQTGANQARGLWLPDSPLVLDLDPKRAPVVTDGRATINPQGGSYAFKGNAFYRHKNLRWSIVPLAKMFVAEETIVNASLEKFLNDAQWNQSAHAWFSVGSLMQVYDHQGIKVGVDANSGAGVGGWTLPDVWSMDGIAKRKQDSGWTGLWVVTFPQLISSG